MATALAAILEQDELAFRVLADAAPAMLWTAHADGLCNFFNARWLAFSGRRHDELVGTGWNSLLHPHDRARHVRRYEHAVQKRGPFSVESRLQRGDGAWRWIRSELVPRHLAGSKRPAGFIGTAWDVTEFRDNEGQLRRELVQREMQERALWLRLADAQDVERRRLSAELHDRAGEPLTALRLRLAALLRKPDLGSDVRAQLEQCVRYAGNTTDVVCEVMSDLRPPMLEELGLAATLRWYSEQLGRGSELEIIVSAPQEPPRLPPQVEASFFRIAQECLRNIVRHAKATHADVALSHDGERGATLRVEDDGVGYAAATGEGPRRWGLLTMRERAYAIGARLDIDSMPGEGTCVTVTLEG